MKALTAEDIKRRIKEAVQLERRVPKPGPAGFTNVWRGIPITRNKSERYAIEGRHCHRPLNRYETESLEEFYRWMRRPSAKLQRLILARENGEKWEDLAKDMGLHKQTLQRHYRLAIADLTTHVNRRAHGLLDNCNESYVTV